MRISDWSSDVCSSDLRSARLLADHAWIKIKVDRKDPVAAVAAVRSAAPRPRLIVDANQSWTLDDLHRFSPELVALGVDLLEQPLAAGQDDALTEASSPIPLCADESVNKINELPRLVGRYRCINIKQIGREWCRERVCKYV